MYFDSYTLRIAYISPLVHYFHDLYHHYFLVKVIFILFCVYRWWMLQTFVIHTKNFAFHKSICIFLYLTVFYDKHYKFWSRPTNCLFIAKNRTWKYFEYKFPRKTIGNLWWRSNYRVAKFDRITSIVHGDVHFISAQYRGWVINK